MNKTNARDIIARTCNQFSKITGERVAITFTWNGMLSVFGPDSFKQHITDHKDDVWLSLSQPNLKTDLASTKKQGKPLVDDYMEQLLNRDLANHPRDTLRELLSWATQRSIGCGRNFWGVEALKPAWWPENIIFNCISKKIRILLRLQKNLLLKF